jgi:hypothetical protein
VLHVQRGNEREREGEREGEKGEDEREGESNRGHEMCAYRKKRDCCEKRAYPKREAWEARGQDTTQHQQS